MLNTVLMEYHKQTKGELRDFLSMAIAHLCFINDEIETGKTYLNMVSKNCNHTIANQKYIELALITIKSENIENEDVKLKLLGYFRNLEKLANNETSFYKNLYTLSRILSGQYKKMGDISIAGLLFTKSEVYKNNDESNIDEDDYEGSFENENYWYLAYYDRFATITDMNKLIKLFTKPVKSDFEKLLCEQKFININYYKDLKGTIAFRNNNLQLALSIFKEIPDSFWIKEGIYINYLNENPFIPICLEYAKSSGRYPYKFQKVKFIQQLIDLQNNVIKYPGRKADYYTQLGNAYYNCSYWGNSRLMTSYSKGSCYGFYECDVLFGAAYQYRQKYQNGNYYNCTMAKQYYINALEISKNAEQKAYLCLMLHMCEYHSFLSVGLLSWDWNYDEKYKVDIYLKDFYNKYGNTETYRIYRCPGLDAFIGYKKA